MVHSRVECRPFPAYCRSLCRGGRLARLEVPQQEACELDHMVFGLSVVWWVGLCRMRLPFDARKLDESCFSSTIRG